MIAPKSKTLVTHSWHFTCKMLVLC